MKVQHLTLEIKTGLPNYSSRTTTVGCVADEGESLDVQDVVKHLASEISHAWNGKVEPKRHKPSQILKYQKM